MRPITASDLMNPEVLTVPEDMTVRELAAFLVDNEITGAPVTDRDGRLVGVVSVMDIAETAAGDEESPLADGPDYFGRGWEQGLSDDEREELDLFEDEEELLVGEIMNPEVHSVPEDTSVSEIAMTMLSNHIHRLLVIDEGKAVGIITTSDLLGLLVDEA